MRQVETCVMHFKETHKIGGEGERGERERETGRER